jgi:diguanylate cyclase (GGDEF)-like protein
MKTHGHEPASPLSDVAVEEVGSLGLPYLERMTRPGPDYMSTSAEHTDLPPGETSPKTTGEEFDGSPPDPADRREQSWGNALPARRTGDVADVALTDPLTGLANRTLLIERIDQSLTRSHEGGGLVVAFHIELNNLGYVHDQLGVHEANRILREISRRLLHLVRTDDTVGRISQCELVVAVSVTDQGAIAQLSERMQAAFDGQVALSDREVHMWATFASVEAQESESAPQLLDRLGESVRHNGASTATTRLQGLDGP